MTAEEQFVRIRRSLEEAHGVEAATYLMDRPPGGWANLVTNEILDAKLDALRNELRAEINELAARMDQRLSDQTWRLTTVVIAAQGIVVAAVAAIGALLRFA